MCLLKKKKNYDDSLAVSQDLDFVTVTWSPDNCAFSLQLSWVIHGPHFGKHWSGFDGALTERPHRAYPPRRIVWSCMFENGHHLPWSFLVAQTVKNSSAKWETWVQSLGLEDTLEEDVATHSSILAWRILWTEEPNRLQSMGWQRLRQNGGTKSSHLPWLRWINFPAC